MGSPRAKMAANVIEQAFAVVNNGTPLKTAAVRYGVARNTLK
jgi:hypothetical protein